MPDDSSSLMQAARAVAAARLADAFGHLSVRSSSGDGLLITPPRPLGRLRQGDFAIEVPLEATDLPTGAPKEAWIHLALLRSRPDLGAVCRAQPPAVAAFFALGRPLTMLNGHAALVGEVPLHTDSRLVRDTVSGDAVAQSIGDADSVILRGNGAVTVGSDLPHAVARMWLLERTAELNLQAWAAGRPAALPWEEQQWWQSRSIELLPRIFDYLINLQEENSW